MKLPSDGAMLLSFLNTKLRDEYSSLDELLEDQTVTHLVLDLENLTFMDSSGIGMLLGRLRALQARGGSLSVKHMQPPVEKLFRLSGLDRVIGVEDDIRGGRL